MACTCTQRGSDPSSASKLSCNLPLNPLNRKSVMEESSRAYLLSSSLSSSDESDTFVPRCKTSNEGTHFQAPFPIETAASYLPLSNLEWHSPDLLPLYHLSPASSRLHKRNATRQGTRRWAPWQLGTVAMSTVSLQFKPISVLFF